MNNNCFYLLRILFIGQLLRSIYNYYATQAICYVCVLGTPYIINRTEYTVYRTPNPCRHTPYTTHTVRCTLVYVVQCTSRIVQCTAYIVPPYSEPILAYCTPYKVQCIPHPLRPVQCTPYHTVLYSVQCTHSQPDRNSPSGHVTTQAHTSIIPGII